VEDSKISYKGSEFDHDYYDVKKREYRKYSHWEGPEDLWRKRNEIDQRNKLRMSDLFLFIFTLTVYFGLWSSLIFVISTFF